MVRYYCDVCGKELAGYDSGRIKFRDGALQVEVMIGKYTNMNSGHFCHKCIRDAIVEFVGAEELSPPPVPFVNYPIETVGE
jgi:hypothetical protein